MELQEKLALINENLVEVLNPELIEKPLAEGRNPKIYWVRLYLTTKLKDADHFSSRELQLRADHIVLTCRSLSVFFNTAC
jgi:hypothetical protein